MTGFYMMGKIGFLKGLIAAFPIFQANAPLHFNKAFKLK